MCDYKNILLKSPIPWVIIKLQDNHAIIKQSNRAYKLSITEEYASVVEEILILMNLKHGYPLYTKNSRELNFVSKRMIKKRHIIILKIIFLDKLSYGIIRL